MILKLIAARRVFSASELAKLRSLRTFYVSMKWVVSSIVEPRVVILEITDTSAFPSIFEDCTRVIRTESEATWH